MAVSASPPKTTTSAANLLLLQMTSGSSLPYDVLVISFSHLNEHELCKVSEVSSLWHSAASDSTLWRALAAERFRVTEQAVAQVSHPIPVNNLSSFKPQSDPPHTHPDTRVSSTDHKSTSTGSTLSKSSPEGKGCPGLLSWKETFKLAYDQWGADSPAYAEVSRAWDAVVAWLDTHAAEVVDSLIPGASRDMLNAAEGGFALVLPPALRMWWRLYNGQRAMWNHLFYEEAQFFGLVQGLRLLPLDEAMEQSRPATMLPSIHGSSWPSWSSRPLHAPSASTGSPLTGSPGAVSPSSSSTPTASSVSGTGVSLAAAITRAAALTSSTSAPSLPYTLGSPTSPNSTSAAAGTGTAATATTGTTSVGSSGSGGLSSGVSGGGSGSPGLQTSTTGALGIGSHGSNNSNNPGSPSLGLSTSTSLPSLPFSGADSGTAGNSASSTPSSSPEGRRKARWGLGGRPGSARGAGSPGASSSPITITTPARGASHSRSSTITTISDPPRIGTPRRRRGPTSPPDQGTDSGASTPNIGTPRGLGSPRFRDSLKLPATAYSSVAQSDRPVLGVLVPIARSQEGGVFLGVLCSSSNAPPGSPSIADQVVLTTSQGAIVVAGSFQEWWTQFSHTVASGAFAPHEPTGGIELFPIPTSITTTRGIHITVSPRFSPGRSAVVHDTYFWSYQVRVTNNSNDPVRLLGRHWCVVWKEADGTERTEDIRGPGVVGQTPVIVPGGSFSYTSACPLYTCRGRMHGSFSFALPNMTVEEAQARSMGGAGRVGQWPTTVTGDELSCDDPPLSVDEDGRIIFDALIAPFKLVIPTPEDDALFPKSTLSYP